MNNCLCRGEVAVELLVVDCGESDEIVEETIIYKNRKE
jgi:hypothetical protein